MIDKEKQIEKMKDIVHNLWDKLNQDAITTNDIIDALYNAGYRKIDKDSVVLTGEEYEELKFAKNLLELREETIKYLEDANIRYAEELELKVNKKERKETAEKIINCLADYKEYKYESISYKDWCVPHTIIKHIAKYFDIDISKLNDKPSEKPLSFNGVIFEIKE